MEQRLLKQAGRCVSCWSPSNGSSRCLKCRLRTAGLDEIPEKQKGPGRRWCEMAIDWDNVDLRGRVRDIAAELGVSDVSVYYQKRKRRIGKSRHKKTPTPAKGVRVDSGSGSQLSVGQCSGSGSPSRE